MDISLNGCDDYKKSVKTNQCIHFIPDGSAGFCKIPTRFRCPLTIQSNIFRMSHSTIQDFLRCKCYFWLKHIQGIQVKPYMKSLPLKRGGLWDKLQDLFYGFCEVDDIENYIEEVRIPPMEVARIKGVYKAFVEYVEPDRQNLIGTQQHFQYEHYDSYNGDILLHGYYDRLYKTWFAECKFTGSPQFYENPFFLASQLGTYFLANEDLKEANLEVVKVPDQKPYKQGKSRLRDETVDEFKKRIYDDVSSRPSFYFKGYNRKSKTYGWKFSRNLFDLKAIKNRYSWVIREIKECGRRGTWYIEETGCNLYSTNCDYLEICETAHDGHMQVDLEKFDVRKIPTDEQIKEFIKNGE